MENPIIPIWLIYLSGICGGISSWLVWIGALMVVICIIGSLFYKVCVIDSFDHKEQQNAINACADNLAYAKKKTKFIIIGLIMWFLGYIIPDQKTVYTMMVGSQLTPKNIELVGGSLKSTADYLFEKTGTMIKEINLSKQSNITTNNNTNEKKDAQKDTQKDGKITEEVEKQLLKMLQEKYKN